MLIATLIVTIVTLVKRRLSRRTTTTSSDNRRRIRSLGSSRWINVRRPVPVLAAAVTLIGIAVAAGTLAQC
ncbi:hypothetical protein ACFQZZ_26340 [Nocardia sp. GCM10030253]|uniref:hypothetical protein n=1 Tax=Nocardia sp. GCM10030253 TaxID=3273404 RepID=UPI00363CC81C